MEVDNNDEKSTTPFVVSPAESPQTLLNPEIVWKGKRVTKIFFNPQLKIKNRKIQCTMQQ